MKQRNKTELCAGFTHPLNMRVCTHADDNKVTSVLLTELSEVLVPNKLSVVRKSHSEQVM